MRPIDADALMDRIESETGWGEEYDAMQILVAIEDQPTVDAIPVEWIRKWKRLSDVCDDIDDMLADWARRKQE